MWIGLAINELVLWRDGSCELFPQDTIRQWEERMNARQIVAQVQAELFAKHGDSCPNCGQFNAKVSEILALDRHILDLWMLLNVQQVCFSMLTWCLCDVSKFKMIIIKSCVRAKLWLFQWLNVQFHTNTYWEIQFSPFSIFFLQINQEVSI